MQREQVCSVNTYPNKRSYDDTSCVRKEKNKNGRFRRHLDEGAALDAQLLRDLLPGQRDIETWPHHSPELDQLRHDPSHRVDRNREAHAHAGARVAEDGGVEPHQLAAGIQQRAAAVARIDRGVGLRVQIFFSETSRSISDEEKN